MCTYMNKEMQFQKIQEKLKIFSVQLFFIALNTVCMPYSP